MISQDEAYEIVMKSAYTLEQESTSLNDSLGRVLSDDIFSDINMPPFNKSAMDGFACRKEDLNKDLLVIETIAAGQTPKKKIGKGECAKIMTGAPVPEGANCVIMVEDTEPASQDKIRFSGANTNRNICNIGEDITLGQKVLEKGAVIKPAHIAIMASVGIVKVPVYRQPRVGIITTGSELVEPENKPSASQIRNSNGYQLIAQTTSCGAVPTYYGIAEDNEDATYKLTIQALMENDIVLLTGGVSMGDYDFVPGILQRANDEILFDSVAVQPGKPTVFGVMDKKFCFGLPGNPVSSYVQFELLVKPLIFKLMGAEFNPARILLPMAREYKRKKAKRQSWVPVAINKEGKIEPLEYHGSAHIFAYVEADGMITVPVGKTELAQGELVYVRQI